MQATVPILHVLQAQFSVLADSHAVTALIIVANMEEKWGISERSTVLHWPNRPQKRGQQLWRGVSWPLRLPWELNPFNFLVLILYSSPNQGQIQIVWAWNIQFGSSSLWKIIQISSTELATKINMYFNWKKKPQQMTHPKNLTYPKITKPTKII